MSEKNLITLACAAGLLCCSAVPIALADEASDPNKLHEPVYRVTTKQDAVPMAEPRHPIDPALQLAEECMAHMLQNVHDYTCTMIKRERINGRVLDPEFMFAKVRHQQTENGRVVVPFSVYLRFLKPDSIKGREVIYVAGRHNGKLIAHEGGWKGKVTPAVPLAPNSMLAMRNQRYPITDIGVQTLCTRLIEKGQRDRQLGLCDVQMQPATINKRPCTYIQVRHDQRKPQIDFHLARVFVDNELNLPVRYEAYDFPVHAQSPPQLIEEYTYVDMKVNVGLNDSDFDPANPAYNMK